MPTANGEPTWDEVHGDWFRSLSVDERFALVGLRLTPHGAVPLNHPFCDRAAFLDRLRASFRSGNSVPVERATITREEFIEVERLCLLALNELPYTVACMEKAARGSRDLLAKFNDVLTSAESLCKIDAEAAAHVESVIVQRTHFTGEEPYVGWKGLGLALTETLDRYDALRAKIEAAPEVKAGPLFGGVAAIYTHKVRPGQRVRLLREE